MKIDSIEIKGGLREVRSYIFNIVGGAIVIGNVYYAFVRNTIHVEYWEKILDVINYISKDVFKFAVFLSISYCVGFLMKQVITIIPLSKSRKIFDSRTIKYADLILISCHLEEEKYKCYKDDIELSDSIVHVIQAFGSCLLISTLIFLITFIFNRKLFDLIFFLIFFTLTLGCEIANRGHILDVKAAYKNLLSHIKKDAIKPKKE